MPRRPLLRSLAVAFLIGCTPLVGSAPAPAPDSAAPDDARDATPDDARDAGADAQNPVDAPADAACVPGVGEAGMRDPERSRIATSALARLRVRGALQGPDGSLYVYGGTEGCRGPDLDGAVLRFGPDGALDTDFGVGGRACVGDAEHLDALMDVAFDADGALVAVGESLVLGQPEQGLVARFDARGRRDEAFSGEGGRRYGFAPGVGVPRTAFYAALPGVDGVMLVGGERDPFGVGSFGVVLRVRSDGEADPSFHGGRPWLDTAAAGYFAAVPAQDGYVLAGHGRDARARLVRVGRDGELVTSFGERGVATLNRVGSFFVRALVVDARGGYVVGGGYLAPGEPGTPSIALARFTATGEVDTAFGDAGLFVGTLLVDPSYQLHANLTADCRGRLLAGASTGTLPALLRVTAHGALDPTFGVGGAARITSPSVIHGPMAVATGFDGRATLVTNAADNRSIGVWRFFE